LEPLVTREERAKALTSLYVDHPYRVSGFMALFVWVLLLVVTGISGAWEPPGVGLPFLLAVSTPLCLLSWLGGGFLLKKSIERGYLDPAAGLSQDDDALEGGEALNRRARLVVVALAVVSLVLSVTALAMSRGANDSDSVDVASSLRDVAAIEPPEGFRELEPGQPDVGFMDAEQAAMAAGGDASEARELTERGFVSGWSRHWARGSITDDSLVVRGYTFDSPDAAHEFAVPESCCAEGEGPTSSVPNFDDAMIRSAYRPETEPTGDHLGLPYRVVGIARRCSQVVTVFFRSAEEEHTYAEVEDLLDQVLRTSDSGC
jgi:hypothetical protein